MDTTKAQAIIRQNKRDADLDKRFSILEKEIKTLGKLIRELHKKMDT